MARLCYDTHDHVNDAPYGAHLRGAGVICSCEVLSVILVCGDDGQSGVLGMKQSKELQKIIACPNLTQPKMSHYVLITKLVGIKSGSNCNLQWNIKDRSVHHFVH